ncbi:MAG: right-handed parallel beta-helix repeat-containing protein [Acidimicrobiales bacterium]
MSSDLTIHLAAGTYDLTGPLTLGSQDSGQHGHTIVWQGAPGGASVISGGVTISGWRPPQDGSGIWTASVPATLQTRQLYVDGMRAQLAQGPVPATLTPVPDGYIASNTTMASWGNPTGIEFIYPSGPSNWTETRCRVAGINGTHITMVQPCFDNSSKRDTPGTPIAISGFGQTLEPPTLVADARELLTKPGQWYLDPQSHILSYHPLAGQDMTKAVVVAPAIQTIVQGAGSNAAPIHDLAFRSITFSYAGWNAPSGPDGYSSFQAGARLTGPGAWRLPGACPLPQSTCPYMAWSQTPGNITFTADQRIAFQDDTFQHLGGVGLSLGDGSQDDEVSGSLFQDISSSGLTVGGIDQPQAQGSARVAQIDVTDNYFTATGVEYQDAPAIVVGYAQDSDLTHNQIDDVPYSGISIGWGGWQERYPNRPPLANYSHGNRVANNLIFNHMTTTVDGGGIYTNGIEGSSMKNAEVIENNVVLQQVHPSWAIYTDNGTMYVNIGNNAVWDALYVPAAPDVLPGLSPYFSFGGCGGGPIAFNGNYSVQADPAAGLLSASSTCGGHPLQGVTVTDNHVIQAQDEIPVALLAAAGIDSADRARLHPDPAPTGLPPFTQYP